MEYRDIEKICDELSKMKMQEIKDDTIRLQANYQGYAQACEDIRKSIKRHEMERINKE